LEAGDALDKNFRSMAEDEIERFRREIVERTGDVRAGDNISDQELLRELYCLMAENYFSQRQYANAVEMTQKARRLRDTNGLHRELIERMHAAGADPEQMEPVVEAYGKDYPTYEDRHRMRGYLALAYLRSGNRSRGLSLLGEVLEHDAESARFADTFVRESGTEASQLQAAERTLRTAIEKNPRDAGYLRYVLGFRLYRDAMKDDARAREVLRELVVRDPEDRYSREAVEWLLYHPEDDRRFRADVARIIAARRENLHLPGYARCLSDWQKKAGRNPELEARAEQVADMLAEADRDPAVGLWLEHFQPDARRWPAELSSLLQPEAFGKLNDRMARALAWKRAEYLRRYASSDERAAAGPFLVLACERFRDDYPFVERCLQLTTDYGSAEQGKAVALQMLNLEPRPDGYDIWQRLLSAADKNEDDALAKRGYAWIMKAQDRYGEDPGNASAIGDSLMRHGMEQEAVDYWTAYVSHDRRHRESHACAQRLFARLEGEERIRFAQELARFDTDYHGAYAQWQAKSRCMGESAANSPISSRASCA
jgi:hypothetical protein